MQVAKKTKPADRSSASQNATGEFHSPRAAAGDVNLPVGKVIGPVPDAGDSAATAKNRLAAAINSTAHTIELINSTGGFQPNSAIGESESGKQDVESGMHVISLESPQKGVNPSSNSSSSNNSAIILDSLEAGSPAVASPAVVQKLWLLLARIDGRSGQLLGNSMRFGYDGFRSWVCALIVWNNHTSGDALYNSRSLTASLADLEPFFEQLSGDLVLGSAVKFIREGLMALQLRMQSPLKLMTDPVVTAVESSNSTSVGSVLERAQRTLLGTCSEYVPHIPVNSKWAHGPRTASDSGSNSNSSSNGASPSLGYVIPLHCGHNGWPPREALAHMTKHLIDHNLA